MLNVEPVFAFSLSSSTSPPASSLAPQRPARGPEIPTAVLVVPFLQAQSQQRRGSVIPTAVSVAPAPSITKLVGGGVTPPPPSLSLTVLVSYSKWRHKSDSPPILNCCSRSSHNILPFLSPDFHVGGLSGTCQHDFDCLSVSSCRWLVNKPAI
jgi:hypothetical protein